MTRPGLRHRPRLGARRWSSPSDEVGAPRILLAAAASAVTKPFGVHGVFYRVAGPQAKAIDGPTIVHDPAVQPGRHARPEQDPDDAARAIAAAASTSRSRSSTPTTPAARSSAPARASTAASSSASSPTTRSGRRGSRPRSASCARSPGRSDQRAAARAASSADPTVGGAMAMRRLPAELILTLSCPDRRGIVAPSRGPHRRRRRQHPRQPPVRRSRRRPCSSCASTSPTDGAATSRRGATRSRRWPPSSSMTWELHDVAHSPARPRAASHARATASMTSSTAGGPASIAADVVGVASPYADFADAGGCLWFALAHPPWAWRHPRRARPCAP